MEEDSIQAIKSHIDEELALPSALHLGAFERNAVPQSQAHLQPRILEQHRYGISPHFSTICGPILDTWLKNRVKLASAIFHLFSRLGSSSNRLVRLLGKQHPQRAEDWQENAE